MEEWQKALGKFRAGYKEQAYFERAFLCGSYACGNQNKRSDIDVYMISSDNQDWRERGNVAIDGFLIEYFINPVRQVLDYLKKDYLENDGCTANMVAYGKILSDKNGQLAKLQETAKEYLAKEPVPLFEFAHKNMLYHLWDAWDELQSLFESGGQTSMCYHLLLAELVKAYYVYHRMPMVPLGKLERIFTNADFRERYHITQIPSDDFIALFMRCLKEQSKEAIAALYFWVMRDCGGFEISKFVMHSPVALKE